jgi:hypothetical protein
MIMMGQCFFKASKLLEFICSIGHSFHMSLFFLILLSFADKKLIAQSVAMVGDQAITERQLRLSQEIDQLMGATESSKVVGSDPLARLLLETAAFKEANEFKVSEVKEAEVAQVLTKFKSNGLSNWNASMARMMVIKKLIARRFIESKTESLKVPPTEEQVFQYFQKNRATFGDLPFESFKLNIKAFLMSQQAQQSLQEWFSYLKRKHRVRVMAPSMAPSNAPSRSGT